MDVCGEKRDTRNDDNVKGQIPTAGYGKRGRNGVGGHSMRERAALLQLGDRQPAPD